MGGTTRKHPGWIGRVVSSKDLSRAALRLHLVVSLAEHVCDQPEHRSPGRSFMRYVRVGRDIQVEPASAAEKRRRASPPLPPPNKLKARTTQLTRSGGCTDGPALPLP